MSSIKRKAETLAADDAKKPKANGSITSFFGNPKASAAPTSSAPLSSPNGPPTSSAASASTNPPGQDEVDATSAESNVPLAVRRFDKEAWVAKLSPEQKELLKLEIETLHESWLPYLADEIASESFLKLKRFLKEEVQSGKQVFPPSGDVYSWYALQPPSARCRGFHHD